MKKRALRCERVLFPVRIFAWDAERSCKLEIRVKRVADGGDPYEEGQVVPCRGRRPRRTGNQADEAIRRNQTWAEMRCTMKTAYLSIDTKRKQMMFESDELILRFAVSQLITGIDKILSNNNGFITFIPTGWDEEEYIDLPEISSWLNRRVDFAEYTLEVRQ